MCVCVQRKREVQELWHSFFQKFLWIVKNWTDVFLEALDQFFGVRQLPLFKTRANGWTGKKDLNMNGFLIFRNWPLKVSVYHCIYHFWLRLFFGQWCVNRNVQINVYWAYWGSSGCIFTPFTKFLWNGRFFLKKVKRNWTQTLLVMSQLY